MLFHPHIPEDLSDDDNDYGEDEEEEDDGGDSDFDAKEASRGRQATAKRKRAAGITSINSVTASFITYSHLVTSDNYFLCTFDTLPFKFFYFIFIKNKNAQYV